MDLTQWVNQQRPPAGIGIDLVSVSQLRELGERLPAFIRRTFSPEEQREAAASPDPWVYCAGRFAAKEAVFKALAPLLPDGAFDLRLVETLRRPDGSPGVRRTPSLEEVLNRAGAADILISISNEGDWAIALAQAVYRENPG